MTHVLRYAARTDRGLLRANNQDSVFAGDRLLVIADGMGGHAAGDVASRLVVAAFVDLDDLPLGSDMVRPLTEATREGNAAIAEMVDENPELDGMGTTLTALLFDGPVVALAHVGDSRAYLYRNGVLHQISHDDTFVQSLVDDGRITADEAAHHPQRSLLLRALNGTEMDPSITLRETSPGDRFLICSDGLSDVVAPEAIADALAGPDPDQVADTLIQLALVGGGPDNVTVIVADVVDTGDSGGRSASVRRYRSRRPPARCSRSTSPRRCRGCRSRRFRRTRRRRPEYALHDVTVRTDDESLDRRTTTTTTTNSDRRPLDTDPHEHPGRHGAGPTAGAGPTGTSSRRTPAAALASARAFALAVVGADRRRADRVVHVGQHQVLRRRRRRPGAVFRGSTARCWVWKLASVAGEFLRRGSAGCTPLKVNDLVQAARDQVSAGIPVSTLADARAVVNRLTSQQLPPCPTPSTSTVDHSQQHAERGRADADQPSGHVTAGHHVGESLRRDGPGPDDGNARPPSPGDDHAQDHGGRPAGPEDHPGKNRSAEPPANEAHRRPSDHTGQDRTEDQHGVQADDSGRQPSPPR